MSGISTGVGPFSGINTAQLIEQLLQAESGPKLQAQKRLQQLQVQQAAYLDLNAKLQALKTSANQIRTDKVFRTTSATSSNKDVLSATSDVGAAAGSFTFLVDRLVSSQQLLSRGFADKDVSAVGAGTFVFETANGRLDRDTALADLNGAKGVERGKIVVTDSTNASVTIDLSKAATVNDVLDAINGNGVAKVTASVVDGKFVVTDVAGGTVKVADATGSTTATSLGISGTATGTLTGSSVYYMSADTTLASFNDGNGVSIASSTSSASFSFTINVDGTAVKVNLGDLYEVVEGKETKKEGAVSTLGGAIKRINDAMDKAGLGTVRASVASDGARMQIVNSAGASTITVTENSDKTATDLGILGTTTTGTLTGRRAIAGLNSTLARSLNGGSGVGGDGTVYFTAKDGTQFSAAIGADASLDEIVRSIQSAAGTGVNGKTRVTVSLNKAGTGLLITDNTGGAGALKVTGTTGADTAASLGISTGGNGVDGGSGVTGTTVSGTSLQHQYVSRATHVSDLNGGKGLGTGKFVITDSFGGVATVDIGSDTTSVGQLLDEINSRGLKIKAEINARGDGILIREETGGGPAGSSKIKISDGEGAVAKNLRLTGEAKGTGTDNRIDGSAETTITFDPGDTLQNVVTKINSAGAGVSAVIIRDGAGSTPFRLSLSSQLTGREGRFTIDTGALDLGTKTLDAGENARAFFGSTDPAKAVLVSGSTNTLDNIISGVKIDLKGTSEDPVTLTIASNTQGIVDEIGAFVKTFNSLISRIDAQSGYDTDTSRAGPLLGDGTTLSLRASLYNTVLGAAKGVTGTYSRLTDVGIKVGNGGTLSLDETKLRKALETDPAGVESVFSAYVAADDAETDLGNGITVKNPNAGSTFSSLGVVSAIERLGTRYLDTVDGLFTIRKKALDDEISSQNDRITSLDARLASRRTILQNQFLAMEQAIGQLQQQQGALGQLG